jgi:hypothetical protein
MCVYNVQDSTDEQKIICHALSSIEYIAGLTGALRETVVGSYVAGLKHAYSK